MDDRTAVRSFVKTLLHKKDDDGPFSDSDSLVLSGRLDSINVLEIVVFLEKQYDFDFGDRPFDQGAVDSVDEIVNLITSTRVT
jgi:acyl carrier protein